MYCPENCLCTLCREYCVKQSASKVGQMASKNRPPVIVPKPKFIQMIRATDDNEKDKQQINLVLKRRSSDGFDKLNRKPSVASKCGQSRVECNARPSVAPLTKSMSCDEIRKRFESRSIAAMAAANNDHRPPTKASNGNHKTVIYFGDSISNKKQISWPVQNHRIPSEAVARTKIASDVQHAKRLCDEMVFKRQQSIRLPAMPPPMKIELRSLKVAAGVASVDRASNCSAASNINGKRLKKVTESTAVIESGNNQNLPHFVESITNGVINIKIEGSYDVAAKLVQTIENGNEEGSNELTLNDGVQRRSGDVNAAYYDWSFVQNWRSR